MPAPKKMVPTKKNQHVALRVSVGPRLHPSAKPEQLAWLKRFWAGERAVMGRVYEEHFDNVQRAVGRVLSGPDAETVVHEVFFRLVAERTFRERFRGGSLASWLATVGRNRAIDFCRRKNREMPLSETELRRARWRLEPDEALGRAEARRFVESFRKQLPEQWQDVFEARFIRQLTQREAAAELSMPRSSLAYQEVRIKKMLKEKALERRVNTSFSGPFQPAFTEV